LAALAAGIVDATPLDVAYIQRTEKLGFNNLLYLGDVANLRLGGFGPQHGKDSAQPGANLTSRPGYAEGTEVSENQQT